MGSLYLTFGDQTQVSAENQSLGNPWVLVALSDVTGNQLYRQEHSLGRRNMGGGVQVGSHLFIAGSYHEGVGGLPSLDGRVFVFQVGFGTLVRSFLVGVPPTYALTGPFKISRPTDVSFGLIDGVGTLFIGHEFNSDSSSSPNNAWITSMNSLDGEGTIHHPVTPLLQDDGLARVGAAFVVHRPNTTQVLYSGFSFRWNIRAFDLVTRQDSLFWDHGTTVRDLPANSTTAARGMRIMANGTILIGGGNVAFILDANGNLLRRLDLDLIVEPDPAPGIEPVLFANEARHSDGHSFWGRGRGQTAFPQTLWKLPGAVGDMPTTHTFEIPVVLMPGITPARVHVLQNIVHDKVDLPLRQRQRNDCLQPGTSVPCPCLVTGSIPSAGVIICIPPFHLRIITSVQFGGGVGPRNSYL